MTDVNKSFEEIQSPFSLHTRAIYIVRYYQINKQSFFIEFYFCFDRTQFILSGLKTNNGLLYHQFRARLIWTCTYSVHADIRNRKKKKKK